MTGKVFNGNPATFLILILPLAAVIVLLYKAWIWVLGFVALIVLWKLVDNYQWQQWCVRINPIFNQLLQEHQGKITPMDLSLKTNLSAGSAKRFLARKAEEYGANTQDLPTQGKVYYFITASTLGSIFDDSEPVIDEPEEIEDLSVDDEEEEMEVLKSNVEAAQTPEVSVPTSSPSLSSPFAQLAELKEERQQLNQEVAESASVSESKPTSETSSDHSSDSQETTPLPDSQSKETVTQPKDQKRKLSLIQADLAKRLDTTPSTIGRRKTDSSFAEWSQSKDPEGVAWKYLRKSKVFIPVDPEKRHTS